MLEAEIRSLQRRLVRRDNEILKQERELHKLRVSAVILIKKTVLKIELQIMSDLLHAQTAVR